MRNKINEITAESVKMDEVVSGQIAAVEEEVEVEAVEEILAEEPVVVSLIGAVSGCELLNVRKTPVVADNVVCTLKQDELVVIDVRESADGWYKIYTEAGIEGYCMVQYIAIKE